MRIRGQPYTGLGQTIAILDSGVNAADPRLAGADISGMSIRMSATSHVLVAGEFADEHGHGTEVAAAIHAAAPAARLLCIKIMDGALRSTADLMAAGIELASRNAGVINLSLGTPNMGKALLLRDGCTSALQAGAIVVAAAHPRGERAYPADLPETLGVTSHPECPREKVFHFAADRFPGRAWGTLTDKFLTYGYAVGADGEQGVYKGSGLAAAHLSAYVACLREAMPGAAATDILDALRQSAVTPTPELGYS